MTLNPKDRQAHLGSYYLALKFQPVFSHWQNTRLELTPSQPSQAIPKDNMTPREQPLQNDYEFTFDNRTGGTPLETGDPAPYKVSEHLLWAPRKMRVASIGAGASGIMLCYKKEKEFGDAIDLVVYERKFPTKFPTHQPRELLPQRKGKTRPKLTM